MTTPRLVASTHHLARITCLVLLAAGGFVGATVRRATAACVPLAPAQMELDPGYEIPLEEPDAIVIEIPDYGVVSFPPHGGALLTLQVVPPQMTEPADVFVPGEDYTGCVDAETGEGQIDFQRAGPYFVRAGYADGHFDHFEVHVISVPSSPLDGPVASRGATWVQVSTPNGAHGYRGADFASDPTGHNTQTSIEGLVSQIKTDYGNAGGQIDVALRYHGAAEQFTISKGQWVSTGPKGKANFDKLCQALRGRAKSVTLQTCNTGKGPKGCQFLKDLSACAGGIPVSASTGKVTTTWKKSNPSGTVKTITNGSVVSSTSCQ